MINPIDYGGLKIIHVESFAYALKTSWIKCFIDILTLGTGKFSLMRVFLLMEKSFCSNVTFSQVI